MLLSMKCTTNSLAFFADMTGADRSKAWYEIAFGELYPILYAHRDDASAAAETAFAVRILGIEPGDRVLDVGCGGGRHQRALEEHGACVLGVDLSRPLLEDNKARGGGHLVRADMRALPLRESCFDVATSFFTSFGYFESDDEDVRVLSEVARVVRAKGRYLLDYLYSPVVKDGLVPRTDREIAGYRMVEERRIENERVKKRVSITPLSGGDTVTYEESVRLYRPADLVGMLDSVGFSVTDRYGALDGSSLGDGSRCVLVGERAS